MSRLPVVLIASAVAAAWTLHAHGAAEDPRRTFNYLLLGSAVFTLLPVVMAAAMLGVLIVPALLLPPIALVVSLCTGRATGLGGLLRDLCRPGLDVVPGYLRALRRIRSPLALGMVLGSLAALPLLWLTLP